MRDKLTEWRLTGLVDDAEVVVTELVSNAAKTGCPLRAVVSVRPRLRMELMDRLCTAVGRPEDSVAPVTRGTLGVGARSAWPAPSPGGGGKRCGYILTSDLSHHGMSALVLARRQPRPQVPPP